MRAVLSIGSNIGDRRAHLDSVVEHFRSRLVAVSSYVDTLPWGNVKQERFLNAVLIVDVDESPEELLDECQELERRAHRERKEHWGPRTLDVDIVEIPGAAVHTERLTVPHPYAHERRFVLEPWLEIDPGATLGGTNVAELLEAL